MAYTLLTESRADALMDKRGIFGHVTAVKFRDDFKSYLARYDCITDGDCNKTLDILEKATVSGSFRKTAMSWIVQALSDKH